MIAGKHTCLPFVAMNRISIVVAQCIYHHSVAQQLTWLTSSLRLVAKVSVAVPLVNCRHSSSSYFSSCTFQCLGT